MAEAVERVISEQKLRNLLQLANVTDTRMGEARGELGEAIKKAESNDGLCVPAFRIVKSLSKKDSGDASRVLRQLERYCEMLGIGGQTDIEDAIEVAGEDEGDEDENVVSILAGKQADEIPSAPVRRGRKSPVKEAADRAEERAAQRNRLDEPTVA